MPRSEGERSSLFSAISFLQIRFYKSVGRGSGKDEGRGRLTLFSKSTLQPARPRVATTTNERAPMMQTEPATDGEQLRVKALASRRRVHFAVHDHILINLRLAELHRAQGRLDEAEPLVAEALAMKKQVHGAVNDHILINLRLAELHGAQGRLDEVPKPLYSCHLHRPPVTPLSRHLHPLPTQSHSYPTLAALLLPCASNRPTPSVLVPPPSLYLQSPPRP